MYIAEGIEMGSGKKFLEFFQSDIDGVEKGIVAITLRSLP